MRAKNWFFREEKWLSRAEISFLGTENRPLRPKIRRLRRRRGNAIIQIKMPANEQSSIIEAAIRDRQDRNIPLSCLTFALTDFNDEGLRLLVQTGVPIKQLFLMRSKITDQGMPTLDSFEELSELDISGTSATTRGLHKMARKQTLTDLKLNLEAVVDAGFGVLAQFSSLRKLTINQSYSDAFIHYHRDVGDGNAMGIEALSALTKLEKLTLRGVPLNANSLEWLSGMSHLKFIDLSNTHANTAALMHLAKNPKLTALYLSNTGLDDQTLKLLVNELRITELGLANTSVTDDGVLYLSQHAPLKTLFAEEVRWSKRACESLFAIPSLEGVELNIDGIPHEFLEELNKKHPSVSLHP